MATIKFEITHFKEGDNHDFNLRNVPHDIMLPLIKTLQWENQKRNELAVAPSFKEERALQQQRHIEQSIKNGENPKQIFLDFPV